MGLNALQILAAFDASDWGPAARSDPLRLQPDARRPRAGTLERMKRRL